MIVAGGPHCGLRSESVLGGEIYERRLIAALGRQGVRVKVGLPRSRPLDAPLPGAEATLLRPGRGLRWPVAPVAFVPYTLSLLQNDQVDLLRGHSVLYTGPSLLLARRLARKRVPVVLHHLHTDARWARLEALVLRRADAVVTISESSRRQLLEVGVKEARIHVAYPGVEGPPAGVEPWREAWPTDGLRLLFIGRLIRRKRPEIAIEALRRLVADGVDASLLVAGQGPLAARLRQQVNASALTEHVRFLGPVADHLKWQLLAAADGFLFPSELEGFGFAAAEAQRAGLPVLGAEGTATSEIVIHGETGYVVPAAPEAFSRAAARLVDESVRRRLGERARELSLRFDWDDSAKRVAKVYADVVARFRANVSASLATPPAHDAPRVYRDEQHRDA